MKLKRYKFLGLFTIVLTKFDEYYIQYSNKETLYNFTFTYKFFGIVLRTLPLSGVTFEEAKDILYNY